MTKFVTYELPEREPGELDLPDGKWSISEQGILEIPEGAEKDEMNGVGVIFNDTKYPILVPVYEQEFFALYVQNEDHGFWHSWYDIHKASKQC